MYTKQDLELLQEKGISLSQIEAQLENFANGFPYLPIVAAASVERCIMKIEKEDEKTYVDAWQHYLKSGKKVTKFVPASGAASRMFKDLYAFIDAKYDVPTTDFEKTFFANITQFAFYKALNQTCKELYGKDIQMLCDENRGKDVVRALLYEGGLDYGNMPKGLLQFHTYPEGTRTPVGEHFTEGALYAKDANGNVNLHFTISEEHKPMFEALVAARQSIYAQKLDAKYHTSFSIQKPSTDTIAVDMDNQPFRENDGSLHFRPGGHGALIENLNDIDSDVIFIKNIDNVVPDRLKKDEAHYKNLLAGVLVEMQQRAFGYLEKLDSGNATSDELLEMLSFTGNELCIAHAESFHSDDELKAYLYRKLNRPFRVCGMVENVGEPGGGPFIVENPDGTASLQILEGSQIDKSDERATNAFNNGSHFNPVDLVCGVKNYKGEKFDLTQFVDKNTGFISQKSKNGKELKALELPGLWNGAMSDWNTIFVEVPVNTFNPVKTVNDLLRAEHQ